MADEMLMRHDKHADALLESLWDLYQRHLLTDVVLVVEGVEFNAHSTVLISYSQYFKNMLDTTAFYNDRHFLKNSTPECVELLLDFMYSGSLRVNRTNVLMMLASASQLQITQAVELCQQYMEINLSLTPKGELSDVVDKADVWASMPVSSFIPTDPMISIKEERCDDLDPIVQPTGLTRDSDPNDSDSDWRPNIPVTLASGKSRRSPRKKQLERAKTSPRKGSPRKSVIVPTLLQIRKNFLSSLERKHFCGRCSMTFAFSSLLHLHGKTHGKLTKCLPTWRRHQVDAASCGICGKDFKLRSQLQRHLSQHHSVRCKKCSRRFRTFAALRRHRRRKHKENLPVKTPDTFTCFHCLKVFLHHGNFTRHSVEAHSSEEHKALGKPDLHCRMCEKHYVSTKHFEKHLVKHGLSERLIALEFQALSAERSPRAATRPKLLCPECPRSFSTRPLLRKHMAKIHKSKLPSNSKNTKVAKDPWAGGLKWQCQECNQRCSSYKDLRQHMQTMHPLVMFPCPHCSYQTQIKAVLERHITLKHETSHIGRMCEMCGKTFPKKYHLKFHRFSKHNIPDPSIQVLKCGEEGCEYTTFSKSSLRKHSEKHNTEKPFSCDICGKLLKTERNLQLHINKKHMNIRPYICDQCGVSYGQESELKTHMVRHGMVKQYQCEHCDYASHDKDNYRHHLYALHKVKMYDRMKIFACSLCDFNTTLKYRYTNHMKVHMNIRDLPCPECGKFFMTKNAMRQHIVKVHKPKCFKCECCSYATSERSKLVDHVRIMHTHRDYKPYKCAYCEFLCATSGNCRKHVMQRHRGMDVKYVKLAQTTPVDFNLSSIQPKEPVSPTTTQQIQASVQQPPVETAGSSEDIMSNPVCAELENVVQLPAFTMQMQGLEGTSLNMVAMLDGGQMTAPWGVGMQ